MIGRVLSHYRIEELLGQGGMGVVYRAWDQRLNRPVALKRLTDPTLGDPEARRQFKNEATALLRLSHPRIGTIFDFDHADGIDFIVMELVAGAALDRRILSGPMPLDQILDLGTQVAEALDAAHDEGVVHRDLKPSNILVTPKDQVKVVDFGLAKLLRPSDASVLTASATSSSPAFRGTPAYMAPEQISTGQIDKRTDVHAFATLIYEMTTGVRPYRGATPMAQAHAILHETPAPPSRLRPGIPAALEALILRGLQKDPAARFKDGGELLAAMKAIPRPESSPRRGGRNGLWSAAAVAAALVMAFTFDAGGIRSRWFGPGAGRGIHSLAVLPLANLSLDPGQQYFADGMTDALISRLGRVPDLRVISRTSVMRYRVTTASLKQIGQELGVDAILEGSILRSGNQVRITTDLVSTMDDRQLWSESYDRALDDVFALQSDIAQNIAAAIENHMQAAARPSPPRSGSRRTEAGSRSAEAQEAYLKGRYFVGKGTQASLQTGLRFFEEALRRDSTFAAALAAEARCYVALASTGAISPAEGFRRARGAATRALATDDGLADAHAALALARFYGDWDWKGAERSFRRALELDPGDAGTHSWYSSLLSALGRHDEAIAESRKAEALDPLSLSIRLNVGIRHYYARRWADAEKEIRKTLELEPGEAGAHYWLGLTLHQLGRHPESLAELQQVGGPAAIGALGYAYASSGQRAQATEMLQELAPAGASRGSLVSPYDLATLCAGLGRRDEAFEWLNRALQSRETQLANLRVDPLLDPLRDDRRFQALARRVGVAT